MVTNARVGLLSASAALLLMILRQRRSCCCLFTSVDMARYAMMILFLPRAIIFDMLRLIDAYAAARMPLPLLRHDNIAPYAR